MAITAQEISDKAPTTLEKLIRKSRDPSPVVAFFEGMAERDRRALAPVSIQVARDLADRYGVDVGFDTLRDDWTWPGAVPALLATATLTELKRMGQRGTPASWDPVSDACIAILLDRRPAWICRWCGWLLDRDAQHWPFVRQLVRDGMCDAPDHPNYVLGMIGGLTMRPSEHAVLDGLLSDKELLDDMVWRLFDTEGTSEARLTRSTLKFDDPAGWAYALRQLSVLGELDRARLLDTSLDAMARDLDQEQTGWFARFHDYLEPTPEERAARAEAYLSIVANPFPTASGMAIRSLEALRKAGKTETGLFLDQIEPALFTTTKGNAKHILRILSDIAKQDEANCSRAVLLSATLLEHPDTEIQELAFKLLERSGDPDGGEMRDAVEQRLAVMAPSVRNLAAAWIGAVDMAGSSLAKPDSEEFAELKDRVAELPPNVVGWFGLDAVLGELRSLLGEIPAVRSYPPAGRRKLSAAVRKRNLRDTRSFIGGLALILAFLPVVVFVFTLYWGGVFVIWLLDRLYGVKRRSRNKPYEAPYGALLAETLYGDPGFWNKVRLFLRPRPGYAREIWWSSERIERTGSGGAYIGTIRKLAMEPGVPLGPVGALMIALDLQMSDTGDRHLATDLLIDTIEAGKMDGPMLGRAIVTLFNHGALRPQRITPCIKQAAETSPLHTQAIRLALEQCLPRIATMPRDLHLLLELYYELSVEMAESVKEPECRALLQAIEGSARPAKAARKLLALEEGDPLPRRRAAAVAALRGRLERAERWPGLQDKESE